MPKFITYCLKFITYILRLMVFTVIVALYHEKLTEPIMIRVQKVTAYICGGHTPLSSIDPIGLLIGMTIGLFFWFATNIGATYLFAKICGLFKNLDSLKKWQAFLIFLIVSIFLYRLSDALDLGKKFDIYTEMSLVGASMSLVPAYLFYLYLNSLSKKHPSTFGKIGYYTSFDFIKDIFRKIKTLINLNYNQRNRQ